MGRKLPFVQMQSQVVADEKFVKKRAHGRIGAVGRSSVVTDSSGTMVLVGPRMDQRCYTGLVAFAE